MTEHPKQHSCVGPFGGRILQSFWTNIEPSPGCRLSKGRQLYFWSGHWKLGDSVTPLSQRFQRLFSYTKDSLISVKDALPDNLLQMFQLPLSSQAYEECLVLEELCSTVHTQADGKDVWLGLLKQGDVAYRAKAYYTIVHSPVVANPVLNWIWKSCCTLKIKVFAWLMIMDRLNTMDMLERRHWNVSDNPKCVLCPSGAREDSNHLFFQCNFSERAWNYIRIYWPMGMT